MIHLKSENHVNFGILHNCNELHPYLLFEDATHLFKEPYLIGLATQHNTAQQINHKPAKSDDAIHYDSTAFNFGSE